MTIVSKEILDWLNWVLVTSHPIRHISENGMPDGFGSAALVDYLGKRFLLTVQHHKIPLSSNGWALMIDDAGENGTEVYWPRGFHYIAEINPTTEDTRLIDFAYCELPVDLNTIYQHRTPFASGEKRVRHVFGIDSLKIPSHDQTYAFAGDVKPEQHGHESIATEMNVYPGIKYLHTENEMHLFKLPVPHPGHEQFKGCSGAPIVDLKNQIVALVCDGDEETGTIRGISVEKYRFALDYYSAIRNHA